MHLRQRSTRLADSVRALAIGAAVSVAYVGAARLGFHFAFVAEQVTTVWAPTGIGLATLLLLGPSFWPAIYVGALLANVGSNAPLWTAAVVAVGNTLEAVVGAWALRRRPRFDSRLRRVRDVVAFVIIGAAVAPVVSATIGVATLCWSGVQPWPRFATLWEAWYLGDAMGALVVAPALLTMAARWSGRQALEALALVSGTMATTQVVFGHSWVVTGAHHPLGYVIFPFVIAAAMRGGQRVSALVVLGASAITIANTARGAGPFASPQVHDSLVLLQVFMGVLAGTGLLLAAAIHERETGERRRAAAARVGEVLADAPDLASAAPAILHAVCRALEWQVGALWLVDQRHEHLRCLEVWTEPGTTAPAFVAATRALAFTRGEGLPGRVWADRRAAWIDNVVHDTNFPRAAVARDADLHGAFGFPIALGEQFLGVIEFFNRTVEPPDPDLLLTMSTVGHQVGQFMGRKREEAAVRAAELEREQLLVREASARLEAEAANQGKDEFLATLSHELRTPLNAILGWTRILLDGADGPGARHALEVINRNAQLQAQLVSDILDVSRIISGRLRLELQPVNVADVISSALDGVRPAADARQVQLRSSLTCSTRTIMADPHRLQQIVWNLLSNAIKFTSKGGGITLELADAAFGRVRLRICDDGVGIDPAFLPLVFDRFKQADGSASRQHGGLGLGLAIVRHLVELHGGAVFAESPGLGMGATFTVELPGMDSTSRLTGMAGHSGSSPWPESPSPAALAGYRILVVDDQEDARELVEVILVAASAQVVGADSTADALSKLAEGRYDALLSDIGMPGPDGYCLIEEIRRREAASGLHLPAAAVTAYATPNDRDRAIGAGFDMHITKPIDPQAIVSAVLSLCRLGDATGTARPRSS